MFLKQSNKLLLYTFVVCFFSILFSGSFDHLTYGTAPKLVTEEGIGHVDPALHNHCVLLGLQTFLSTLFLISLKELQ